MEVSEIKQCLIDTRAVFHLVNKSFSLEETVERASRIIQVPERNFQASTGYLFIE